MLSMDGFSMATPSWHDFSTERNSIRVFMRTNCLRSYSFEHDNDNVISVTKVTNNEFSPS